MINSEQCKRRQKVGCFCMAHSKKHTEDKAAEYAEVANQLQASYHKLDIDIYGMAIINDPCDDL